MDLIKSINVIPECPTDEIIPIARRAEQHGFDRCWIYDEGLVTRDVYVVMAAVLEATRTMAVGPGITNPYTRHPAQTASSIATLDEVSGGRAFLGIGAGGSLTLDPIGIDRHKPLTAVRESIEIARALFAGTPAHYEGSFASLHGATIDYARADIEIWLAGRGPKMLALGGSVADGVMLDFIHKDSLAGSVATIRSGGPARICYSTAIVTDHDDLEFVRPHMTYRLVDSPDPVKEAIGLGPDDVDRIRGAMSGGLHAAASHVRDEWIEPFIITGSISSCAAEIRSLMETHAMEEFLLPMFDMPAPIRYLDRVAQVLNSV